jgi:predicted extracellular nuclease
MKSILAFALLAAISPVFAGGPSGTLVINEIDYDQVGTDTAEYVEIKNVSASAIDLSLYEVILVNGTGSVVYAPSPIALPSVMLAPGDYFVLCGNPATTINCDLDMTGASDIVQNGAPDAVGIRLAADGAIVDVVSYEGNVTGFFETAGVPGTQADSNATAFIGLSRFADGADTDNNSADLSLRCISPGTSNLATTSGCTAPAAIPVLSITAAPTIAEGNPGCVSGTNKLIFPVTAAPAPGAELAFTATISGGSATAPSDIGTLAIVNVNAGGNGSVEVPVNCDLKIEGNETVEVTLQDGAAYDLNAGSTVATATINNDDLGEIFITNVSQAEGTGANSTFAFNVSLGGGVLAGTGGVSVNYDVVAAGATPATITTDFTGASATLTILEDTNSGVINVTVIADSDDESDETFAVNLSSPVNATIVDNQALGTIQNDDSVIPQISINDVGLTEADTGTSNLTFTVSIDQAPVGAPVVINYSSADVSAAQPGDYTTTTGQLSFPVGVTTSQQIIVPVVGDCSIESPATETFSINLALNSGSATVEPSGTGTITDNDVAITAGISVAPASAAEGQSATNTRTVTVTLNQAMQCGDFTYSIATSGDATSGVDYQAFSVSNATISGAATEATHTLTVNGDLDIEVDEVVGLTLTGAGSNVTLSPNTANATIQNDDQPRLSINDVSLAEGNGGTTSFVFTVTMDAAPISGQVTVSYATANGSATAGTDYTTASNMLMFDAANLTRTITVEVTGETTAELDETFLVNLSNPVGGTISDAQGLGTIIDDDLGTIRIHQVQGSGAFSPIVADPNPNDATIVGGAPVRVVDAVVTAVTLVVGVDGSPADQNGFFMQSADADADQNALTSEGILVFTGSVPSVVVGDVVTVVGQAQERFSQTQIATNLTGGSVTVTGSSAPLPTPVAFSAGTGIPSRNPAALSCPGTGSGGPNNTDTNFECFEGMRVAMTSATVSASNQRRVTDLLAEAYITPWGTRSRREEGLLFGLTPEVGNAAAGVWDGNPEVLEIDLDEAGLANVELTAGSTFNATGVIGFSFGDYEFYPTQFTLGFAQTVPEAVMEPAGGSELTIGSFNTQHLCDDPNNPLPTDTDDPPGDDDGDAANTGDGDSDCERDTPISGAGAFNYANKLRKVSSYVLNVLKAPDVLGLQEVDELTTLQALAAQISADGGPAYQSFLVEGNDPGGIDVGFMVRTDRVSGASVEQFYKTKNWYDPVITCAPGAYPCENLHDRPPLILRAVFNGTNGPYPFAVLNNHTKSIGNVDDEDVAGNRDRAKRYFQGRDIGTLVQQFQTATGPFNGQGTAGIPLILVGDYNAFEYTDGHVDVVGLVAGTYVDAENECNAVLSDGQGTETCNLGANIVNPPLFNSVLAVPESERMSYKFTQDFNVVQGSSDRDVASVQVIDHILLSRTAQGFYLGTDFGISNNAAADETNRLQPPPTGPVTPIRASDHDGLVAYLDFNCTSNMDLNPDGDAVCGMLDNCPAAANNDQADTDGDGQGDVCDPFPNDNNLLFSNSFE